MTPRFKGYKKTKELVRLKQIFDAPIRNGVSKSALISKHNNGYLSYDFDLSKDKFSEALS